MQKWEYLFLERDNYISLDPKVDSINGKTILKRERVDFFEYVEELGKQGWEMVSAYRRTYNFKRPIIE